MKAAIKKEDLDSHQLSWLCIEPMLLSVRRQDLAAKREVYLQLNEGQQALYLFYSYHNHTRSLAEFYWFSAYHIMDLQSWNGIREGMQFFQLDGMVRILDDIEALLTDAKKSGETRQGVSPTDLDHDPQLRERTERVYAAYQEASQKGIMAMNEWVRHHQDTVVEMKEEV